MKQRTLVLIKPDAVSRGLTGGIISDLDMLGFKMVGLKLVEVKRELAEKHYQEHREKNFFEDLIKHLTGELHNNEKVIAIIYEGDDVISKIRNLAGNHHPEKAEIGSIRNKYGGVHSETKCFENVIHTSDSQESAEKEISLWFKPEELLR